MIARRARTNDDRDDDTSDQRHRHFAFGSAFGSGRLLSLGRDGDGLGNRQEKGQRCTGEGVHVVRE